MNFPKEKLSKKHPRLSGLLSAVLFFISLFILDPALRTIYVSADTSPLPPSVPLFYTLCWCLILTAISAVLPRVARRIYAVAVTCVFALFTVVHEFFYSFFGTYMSFSAVTFAEDGAGFFDWSYFSIPKTFLLVIAVSVILSVLSAHFVPDTKYKILPVIACVLVFAGGIFGINLLGRACFSEDDGIVWSSTQSPLYIYDCFTDQFTCMHMVGLYQYSFRDFLISTGLEDRIFILNNDGMTDGLDEYYGGIVPDPDNEMTGAFSGKNLIIVQLEAIDTWMVRDEVMPNLSAIKEKSLDFENYYAPKYLWGATFNSENVVNTGMISPTNSSKTGYFTDTYYPYSMANLFRGAGYSVNSFHRSNGTIYNRGKVHLNWGYERYNSGADMGLSDYDLDSRLIEAYDMMVNEEKFMSFIITYSGHGPYSRDTKEATLYYDEISSRFPDGAEEEYICALCHAHETDVFIGELLDRLKEDGHINDTVLIFYTDHYDHYITDIPLLEKYKGTSDLNLMCRVPFFIYSADTGPMKVEKVIATYDVLPTVVNLFGLDTDGRYYVGNDAFSEGGGYVIFPDRSWLDADTYFSFYKSEPTPLSRERGAEIDRRLNNCWNAIKLDYFRIKEK